MIYIETPNMIMIRKLMTGFFIKKLTQRWFLTECGFCAASFFVTFFFENNKYITGRHIHVTKNEQTNVMIIVLVSTLKYAPATPLMSANGMKITMVLSDEPTIA